MARELKVGIAVIGLLLIVFCGLLAKRLTRPTKMPLTSISTPATPKPNATTVKPAAPAVRPTLVTPQVESSKPQGTAWSSRAGQATVDSQDQMPPKDRYGDYSQSPTGAGDANPSSNPTATQPGLLTTALPIQDLEGKQPPSSGSGLPYQSGYAGTSDAQDSKGNAAATNTQPPADPFQRSSAKSNYPKMPANPAPAARYPEYTQADDAKTPGTSDFYVNTRTPAATPKSQPGANQDYGSSTASNPTEQYLNGSYGKIPTSPANPSYNATPQNSSGYAGSSHPPAGTSQWQGAPVTPVSAPTSPTPSIERNGEKYNVQPNDTFWTISEKTYGTGAFFKALYEYNRKKHKQADELVVGQELLVPDENVLRRYYPDLCPRAHKAVASTEQRLMTASTKMRGNGRVYQVVEGDTLYDIAKFELGKSSRWAEIYELNRDVLGDDFDYLRTGTELILPTDAPRNDNVTRQPGQVAPNYPSRY